MAPVTRARRASADMLLEDVLFLVLQLLPAKDVCRARTVCRSWRSITSGEAFIREHAGRHKEPLFLAKFRVDRKHVYVVDLSGSVVKRITTGADDGALQVLRTRCLNNIACLATERNACRVLNPATGGIQVLPPVPAIIPAFANSVILLTFFALGLVASTGEYKVLCCWRPFCHHGLVDSRQLLSGVHVLTISGGSGTSHGQWRPRPGARLYIDLRSGVVVDGVVYFLTSAIYCDTMAADYILSFDLAGEEWRRDLHGPSSMTGNIASGELLRSRLTLAELKGSLVLANHPRGVVDVWFLVDFESRLWVKQYTIQTGSVTTSLAPGYHLIPLLALDDGQLVIHLSPTGLLFLCDPGTNTFTMVFKTQYLDSVGVYAGSLLH